MSDDVAEVRDGAWKQRDDDDGDGYATRKKRIATTNGSDDQADLGADQGNDEPGREGDEDGEEHQDQQGRRDEGQGGPDPFGATGRIGRMAWL